MNSRPVLTGALTGGLFAFAVLAAADNLTWPGARVTILVLALVGAVGRVAVNRLGEGVATRGTSARTVRYLSMAVYTVLLVVVYIVLRRTL